MRRKLTEKTSQLEDRAYAAKRKMEKAHKQILSEMAAIKESLGRQSIRLRRARSEPERDLALEQTAQLVNEIVLGFLHPATTEMRASIPPKVPLHRRVNV